MVWVAMLICSCLTREQWADRLLPRLVDPFVERNCVPARMLESWTTPRHCLRR